MLTSLNFNLDNVSSFSVEGLYSNNFSTSYISGSLSGERYEYGGGQDNVTMTGGGGNVIIGGAGSTLVMAGGNNTAVVRLASNGIDSSGANQAAGYLMGSYDGGTTMKSQTHNSIDFSVTLEDDLYFISNGVGTTVYGFASSYKNDMTNLSGGIPLLGIVPITAIDGGTFVNFQLVDTGSLNNSLEIDTGTTIQSIRLDGKYTNKLELNIVDNMSDPNAFFMVRSSLASASMSIIELNSSSLNYLEIDGGGGNLQVNTQTFSGQLNLSLMNNLSSCSTVNDYGEEMLAPVISTPTIRADVQSTGTTSDIFNFYGGTDDFITISDPKSSVVINENNFNRSSTGLEVILKNCDWSQLTANFSLFNQFTVALAGHTVCTINFNNVANIQNVLLQAQTMPGTTNLTTKNLSMCTLP